MTMGIWHVHPYTSDRTSALSSLSMSKAECMMGSTQGEPCEWLHTPGDVGYHETPTLDDDVDEVYQAEELPPFFIVNPSGGLDDLVGDDVELSGRC
jgi:hypothetical protein